MCGAGFFGMLEKAQCRIPPFHESFTETDAIGCEAQLDPKFRLTKTILVERASACCGASDP